MIQPTAAQRKGWEDDGYLVLEDAIKGEELVRLQTAFDRCAREAKPAWLAEVEAGTQPAAFFDIPEIETMNKEDAFLDLVDHPSYYGLLLDFIGDDMIFIAPQIRTVPLSPVSYVPWHPDTAHDKPLHVKVQVYIDDVNPDSGAFAFVPGSHKPDAGPYPHVRLQETMPGHKILAGAAGTAIMFNTYGWHTSMNNRTSTARKSIILTWEKCTPDRLEWSERYRPLADRLSPERRYLFGLERP